MLKKTVVIGAIAVGFVAMRGDEASAHLSGYQVINGFLRHVASFDCGITIRQIPGLNAHPAEFRCEATVTEAQLLCLNPAGNLISPGKPGLRALFVGETAINEGDITDKKKGRAAPQVRIEDDAETSPLMNPENCVNPNWTPFAVLSTKVEAVLTTADCTGSDADPCATSVAAYRERISCSLPPEFSVTNMPPAGTAYNCVVTSQEHLS